MLSYRHGFHAGNFADILKHAILLNIINYLQKKEGALLILDTHSGSGNYSISSEFAQKTKEFESGIKKLLKFVKNQELNNKQTQNIPESIQQLIKKISTLNPHETFETYAGSPLLIKMTARKQDSLHFCELHPNEFKSLKTNIFGHRVHLHHENGYKMLKALLPPPSRRAFVLIDPSYEDKNEYSQVISALKDAIKRFESGTYAIWYPCLARKESQQFPEQLKKLPTKSWLRAELHIRQASTKSFGMFGSGMFIFNPPFILKDEMNKLLPFLKEVLKESEEAQFILEWHQP